MQEHKNFWDKNAGRYDRFMRKDRAAYDEMYKLIRPVVRHKTVLELATGTGLIAKHIVNAATHIEALEHVAMLEQTGQAFVIRPPIPLEIGSMERDLAQLRRVYDTGRAVAEIQVDKIAAFVEQSRAAE